MDSLKVPLPPGMQAVEVIRPRVASDGDLMRKAKMAWKADWYVEMPLDLLTGGDVTTCPQMNSTRSSGKVLPSVSSCKDIFSWQWDAFFDARELRYVDVFTIDIGELTDWGKADLNTQNTQIFYVTFTGTPVVNAATDPKGDGFFPVVRLWKGKEIKSGVGLTIATDRPLYVQGDYNSDPSKWVPAALMGDAIYILSNAWDGSEAQCYGYKKNQSSVFDACEDGNPLDDAPWVKPTASETWVYTAILAGHKATPCDHEVVGCPGGYDKFYGGGIENYPRFLEKWSNIKLTYRGSLVSLHESEMATGLWSGDYYSPPKRDWQFDTRFKDPVNLPPGTPVVGQVIRTAFRPVAY